MPSPEDHFNFNMPAVHLPYFTSTDMLEILRNYEQMRDNALYATESQIESFLRVENRTLDELIINGEELERSGELSPTMRGLLDQLLRELRRHRAELDQSVRNRDTMLDVIAIADMVPDDSDGTDEPSSEQDNRENPSSEQDNRESPS